MSKKTLTRQPLEETPEVGDVGEAIMATPIDRTISLDQLPYSIDGVFDDSNKRIAISQSMLTTFLICRQKYVFSFLMRLKRRGLYMPFITGGAVHVGFDVLLDPKSKANLMKRLPKVGNAIDTYFDSISEKSDLISSNDLDKLEVGRAQAHAIIEAWCVIQGGELESWKKMEPEVEILSDKGATLESPLHNRLMGRVDGIVVDEDGCVWILERKTRSRLDLLNATSLELDPQSLWYIILYCYVLPKRFPNKKWKTPTGFMYDAMQKPMHRMSDAGFDNLKGRMYEAMTSDPDKYFKMLPIHTEQATIEFALKDFTKVIRQMDNLKPEDVTRNLSACGMYSGCEFLPLCQARADASDPRSVLALPEIDLFEIGDFYHYGQETSE